MRTPRIEACTFGKGAGEQWPRLTKVFTYAAERQCRGWSLHVETLPPIRACNDDAYYQNTQKLNHWCSVIEQSTAGDRVLLIDIDTVILRSIDDIWDRVFDVAYTVKSDAAFPLNAGVLFLRVSDDTKKWMRGWRDINLAMLTRPDFHRKWRRKYGGINQASLGYLLEHGEEFTAMRREQLPCAEWNCENSTWEAFSDKTRILHVKSALRESALGLGVAPARLRPLAQVWRRLELQASQVAP